MENQVKLILQAAYFLQQASLESKLFRLTNLLAQTSGLTAPMTELEFQNALKYCVAHNMLEFYDVPLGLNELCSCGSCAGCGSCGSCCCGTCGRYYRVKIGALAAFDVRDLVCLDGAVN
ncbi:hypothetical protein M8J76_003414 [Diaphorina citri]|nr:hypothetical protein M8J75_009015 [Diaphorina citri]KAI5736453.1 hypothetical protein M8J76_003414 [Diaphorina citri]